MKILENLRDAHIGETGLWDGMSFHEMPFISYSREAFEETTHALGCFENANPHLRQYCVNAIVMWFLATESMVTFYSKMLCLKKGIEHFEELKTKSVHDRFHFTLSGFGEKDPKKYSLIKVKLEEFMTFRNEMFHDRYFQSVQNYKKTCFSPVSTQLHISDVLQAMNISVQVFKCLSRLVGGTDLMPQIPIHCVWHRVDNLYLDIVSIFQKLCMKHNLKSCIDLSLQNVVINSTLFSPGEMCICVKAEGSIIEYLHKEKTMVVNKWLDDYPKWPDDGTFVVADYSA